MFIVNPLSGGGAGLKLFSTHPPTEERVARLMAMARSEPKTSGRHIPLPVLRGLLD